MPDPSETTYSPVVHPSDPCSVPPGLGANDELHVPLPPRRDPTTRATSWFRRSRDAHRLVTTFCYSDRLLARWDAVPGRAEALVRRLAPTASLTLDIPFYAFMTAAQRDRALARSLAAIERGVRLWEPAGIEPIPLVKGLHPHDWEPQLDLARSLGLRRAAFYARETLLERDGDTLRAFLRSARRHSLRALLVGAFAPRAPADGGYDAAAFYHYVLARLGRMLTRSGRHVSLPAGAYSDLVGRFLDPRDRQSLTHHNFLRARALVTRPPPLSVWGATLN